MADNKSLLNKIKSISTDVLWTISALVMMNVVAQFVVYPAWSRAYGDEIYGNILYVMSLINIVAVTVGVEANYARMTESAKRETCNADYGWMLSVLGVISAIICLAAIFISHLQMSGAEMALAAILCIATMLRYYADVEYRLGLNYRGYFVYYLIVSIGYLVGIGLFQVTKLWPVALLPGECAGLLFVLLRGKIFHGFWGKRSVYFKDNLRVIGVLIASNIISNIIFNGDRLLLQNILGGTAVTVYYLASLLGKTMSLITTPLNSVIIGYLVRYKGAITIKMYRIFAAVMLILIALAIVGGVIASHILIWLLYPDNYETVRSYFVLATMAQIFYFATNIVGTVLLRIANCNRQIMINGLYGIMFVILCIPGAILYGIDGFAVTMVIVNIVRYIAAMWLCRYSIVHAVS